MFNIEFFLKLFFSKLILDAIEYAVTNYPKLRVVVIEKAGKIYRLMWSNNRKNIRIEVSELKQGGENKNEFPTPKDIDKEVAKSIRIKDDEISLSVYPNEFDTGQEESYVEMKLFYSKFPNSFLDNYSILIPDKNYLSEKRMINTQINHNQRLYFKVISDIIKTKLIEFKTPIIGKSRFYKPFTIKVESQNKQSVLTIEMDGEVLNKVNLNEA